MIETFIADEWLYETLSGDGTLMAAVEGVYNTLAPQQADTPFVLFQLQASGFDLNAVGGIRVLSNCLYLVRVIGEGHSFVGLQTAADRMDALLHPTINASVDNGLMLSCIREQPFNMVEAEEGGQQFRHIGGLYRLTLQE